MTRQRIDLADGIRHVVNVAGATHVEILMTADEAMKLARAVDLAGEMLGNCRPVGTVTGRVETVDRSPSNRA